MRSVRNKITDILIDFFHNVSMDISVNNMINHYNNKITEKENEIILTNKLILKEVKNDTLLKEELTDIVKEKGITDIIMSYRGNDTIEQYEINIKHCLFTIDDLKHNIETVRLFYN